LDLRTLVPPGRRYVLLGLTIVSALTTLAAFPPLSLPGLAWVAPILLMLALSQLSPRAGFWHGWLYGAIFMGGIVGFAREFGLVPWIVSTAVMGLCYGLFGLAAAAVRTAHPFYRVPALAAAWALAEMLRGNCRPLALTFGDLALALHRPDDLPFAQLASLLGHYGVGFLMALVSAGLSTVLLAMLPMTWLRPPDFRRFNRDAGRMAVISLLLVIGVYAWGRYTLAAGQRTTAAALTRQSLRTTVVQAEAETLRARGSAAVFADYRDLTLTSPADLVVWPETAITAPLNISLRRQSEVGELARRMNAHMLIGAGEACPPCTFNSAYFFRPDGSLVGTYRKIDLVIFGEYVPCRKQFPFLKHYPIRPFDFTAGDEYKLFDAAGCRLAPLICYEGTFPGPARRLCLMGAQLIVIITSDTWARGTNEVEIHSPTALFRAIESRRFLVRAASAGQSAIYDPYGNLLAEVPPWRNGLAAATVAPVDGLSTYHRFGDWPLLLGALALLGAGLLRARRGSFVLPPS
jgi:apolipoprotein N-acyltransferase